jgi:hypothetical protein
MTVTWKPYLWSQPRSVDPERIESLEAEWQVKLPDGYKRLLEHSQGTMPEPGGLTVGQRSMRVAPLLTVDVVEDLESYSIDRSYAEIRPHVPGQIFPFASTLGAEYLCFDYRDSPREPGILLVARDMSVHHVANSFQEFLERLHVPEPRDVSEVVLKWPPQDAEAWLYTMTIGEPVEGTDFNWHGFAFTAAHMAREIPSLPWARVSLRVYEELAAKSPEDSRVSFLHSAMNLRACMIIEFGAETGDPVLDPEAIVAHVRQAMTVSFEEAADFTPSRDLRIENIDKIRLLRKIKNALGPLELIVEITDILEKHPDLGQWLQLRSNLP